VARDTSKGDPVTDLIGHESSRLDNVVFCPAHALDLIVARSIHSQIRTTIRDVIYRHEINLLRVRAIYSEVIDVTSVRAVLATTAPDRCRPAWSSAASTIPAVLLPIALVSRIFPIT
jgi:hypothetical protein